MNKSYMDRINDDYERMKKIDSQVIKEEGSGYITKKTIEFTLGDNSKMVVDQIRKSKGNGDAAVIIPITIYCQS